MLFRHSPARHAAVVAWGTVCLLPLFGWCEEKVATVRGDDAEAWVVRSFQYPASFFIGTGHSDTRGPVIQIYEPLSSNATASAIAKETGWAVSDEPDDGVLKHAKISFPTGMVLILDESSQTMAMLGPESTVQSVAEVVEAAVQKAPHTLSLALDILQAEAATIRTTLADTADEPDHAEALHRLQELASQGKATTVRHLQIETRSGKRVSTRQGTDSVHCSGFTLDEKGRVEPTQESQWVGTTFEAEPILGTDGYRVDIDLDIEHHFAPPVHRREAVGPATAAGVIEAPVTDYRYAKVRTSVTLHAGTARLMGVWSPEGSPELEHGDVMQAAFLRVDALPVLPAENKTLTEVLIRHGSPLIAAGPDSQKPTAPAIPPGMERREFRIPPNSLSLFGPAGDGPSAAPDPFAPAGSSQGPALPPRALEILKAQGVTFPDGASAHYSNGSGRLIVINTPAAISLVEAMLGEICYCFSPYLIANNLQIIEGDGALLRELADDSRTVADHGPIWKRVEQLVAEGRVKLLRTARVETRSGQRALFECGTRRMDVVDFAFGGAKSDPPPPATPHATEGAKPGEPQDRTVGQPSTFRFSDRGLMHAEYGARLVGTRLEVDPVIGPDGFQLDVDVAIQYNYSPPTLRPVDEPPGDNSLRVMTVPTVEFHCAGVVTSLTVSSGMTKLLSVWKPESAPEFDGKDVMQAAFLRVDLAPMEEEEWRK